MSSTAEPGELVTAAGVAPLAPLRVGMRFDGWADLPANLPSRAVLIDPQERAMAGYEAANLAMSAGWAAQGADDGFFPLVLLYIPRNYDGPVEAPQMPAEAPESRVEVVVPDTTEPTQEGYRQMMRQKSMAAHPAGKGRPTSPDEAIFCMHNTNPFPGTTDHRCRECGDILPFEYIDGYNMGEK